MNNKLLLIFCFAAAIAVILYLQRRTIQKWNSGFSVFVSLLLKLLAVIVIAYLVIVEPNWLWHVHFPLSGIYIALFADFCGQLIFSIINAFQRAQSKLRFSFKSLTIISFICGVLFLIYKVFCKFPAPHINQNLPSIEPIKKGICKFQACGLSRLLLQEFGLGPEIDIVQVVKYDGVIVHTIFCLR